jgi:GLPGLI family protein
MKKMFLFLVVVLAAFQANAQKDFQGMAIYESKTSTGDFKANMGGREITPEMQKMIEERMKKMIEKTFILNFDQSASIYKEEEKLDAPGTQNGGGMRMMASFMGGGGTFYKNVKEKSYTVDKEFMGKEFLVKDSLPKLDWKMQGETRQIGGYTCYKATAVRPVSQSDFRNFRPKKQNKKENDTIKDETKTEDKDRKTNFMDSFEMPKEITVTAWYAPEIPVNQGPENYWGLPGLILEVNDGKTTILCSKIVLNAQKKVEIKAPKNGKIISQKEYDAIVVKKMEEVRNMRGNGGRNIRFGG